MGNTLFFTYFDRSGDNEELWKSDGTPEGTQLVKDIRPETRINGAPVNFGSDPENLIDVNGTLFFTADDGVNGRELWKSDGTPEGTQLVKNIRPEGSNSNSKFFRNFVAVDGTLYFTLDFHSAKGPELWKSDGTAAGTFQIEPDEIARGDDFFDSFREIEKLIEVNNQLFFQAETFDENEEKYVDALLTLSEDSSTNNNGIGNDGNNNSPENDDNTDNNGIGDDDNDNSPENDDNFESLL